MHRKPASTAASTRTPLLRPPHPLSSALWASISNSPRRLPTFFGMFTSSSHIRGVKDFRGYSHYLWDRFVRKVAVRFLDLFNGHPFSQAGQDERDRESRASNREFAAEKFRISHDPSELPECLQRMLFHVYRLTPLDHRNAAPELL